MATGSTARPATAGSRGPIGRQPTLSPTGYRVSARRRNELLMAGRFTDLGSLQDIIDLAVTEFLERLCNDVDGFVEALNAAEQNVQRRAGIRSVGEAGATKMHKP